jgi:trehalose 6-phosphate phosphatase
MPLARPPKSILRESSLFLDFDGTLVELAPTPDAIQVGDEVQSLLNGLSLALGGRLALLSGRSIADLRGRIDASRLTLSGGHGLERLLPTGDLELAYPPPGLGDAIREFRRLQDAHDGLLVEEKPAGVALHYRNAPEARDLCHDAAQRLAASTGMNVQLGKMVVELKATASDKGQALERFMGEKPFAGTRPIFVGDDLTDEHAFAAALRMGGAGVLAGPERPTSAIYRLENVSDVRRWLRDAAEELE